MKRKTSDALSAALGYAISLVIVMAIAVAVLGFWLAGMAQLSTPPLP